METPKILNNNIITGNLPKLFNPGKEKRVDPSTHNNHIPIKGISLCVALTGGMTNKRHHKTEFKLTVGDLVWATIKKQYKHSWWPATVCDGLNRPTREADCLVRCFGNGNYVWCSVSEVKPFVGYFDRLPSQNKGKKFVDALDEAVIELGTRVKTGFSCSCFSNVKREKYGEFGDCLVTRFEPGKFVEYVRDLARVVDVPNVIDFVVKKNCLFAFYRSFGRNEMLMDQLVTEIKHEEETPCFERSEKPFETRECGIKDGDSMMDVDEGDGFTKMYGQRQSQRAKKRSRKKKVIQQTIVSSSEMLSKLQFAAQDCYFRCESMNFDSVERFIYEFRKRAFNDFLNAASTQPCFTEPQAGLGQSGSGRGKNINLLNETREGYDFTKMYGQRQSQRAKKPRKKWSRKNKLIQINVCSSDMLSQLQFAAQDYYFPFESKNFDSVERFIYEFRKQAFNGFLSVGSTQPCLTEPQAGLGQSGSCAQELAGINLQATPGHVPKKRGRKRKNINLLNENGTDKRTNTRFKINEVGVPCIDLSYNKVNQDNVKEVKGTAFLLKFSPDHPLPCIQDLNTVFAKYGKLIESETQVFAENLSGQVVFHDSCNVGGAFMDLQNDTPLGPGLVNYKIQHLAGAESMVQFKTPIKSNPNSTDIRIVERSIRIDEMRKVQCENRVKRRVNSPLKLEPCQDLKVLKKNLEMMNMMLEKNGCSLPLEMRLKLEGEIKGLMKKVNAMDGSSSC